MRHFLLIFSIILFAIPVCAKHQYLEKDYQKFWCNQRGGLIEYKLPDNTRVDCLLPDYAVEFDFANKWTECIGQALYYGQQTDRIPACVLITEEPSNDIRYLLRLHNAIRNIPKFQIWTITPEELRKSTP